MPAHHHIDNIAKIITIIWEGEATDLKLTEALTKYEVEIKGKAEYADYHEIINFSSVSHIKLTSGELLKIAQLAAKSDQSQPNTKLAIIVGSAISFGFAKIYETYRRFTPRNRKIAHIYKTRSRRCSG